MKKILAIVLALVMVIGLAACGGAKLDGIKYADYVAAAADSDVKVEGYLQAWAYNAQYGNVGLFIMNDDGNFYAYRAKCDDALAAKFKEGVAVRVTGQKAFWEGFHEVGEGATVEVLSGSKVYKAIDVSSNIGDNDAMTKLQGARVALKGAKVVAKQVDGKDVAFTYNWDGSGAAGSNNDLYVDVEVGGKTYTVVVESDEIAEGQPTYDAVTKLEVGKTVDIEGFMYWYNGPQIHIHKITAK